MKAGKEHKVPLSDRVLQILKHMEERSFNEFVFPGKMKNKPLSNMAMLQVIRGMGHTFTTHGFRSTFRDWASEKMNFPSEVVEMALAHAISSKVEKAYRRGDLFEKRKKLMSDWAEYCSKIIKENAKVIEFTGYQTQ